MIRIRLIFLFNFLIFNYITAQEFETHTYFSNDSIELKLDLFLPKKNQNTPTPLVIFVHGGGFSEF